MRARSLDQIERLRAGIDRVGKLSDSVVRVGPFGIGVDGVLAWIPFIPAGAIYSLAAGGFLLLQGYRAHVPMSALAKAAVLLGARSAVTAVGEAAVPFLPVELLVDLFRAHKWTADILLKAIDETQYVQGPEASEFAERASGGKPKLDLGKRHVVWLD